MASILRRCGSLYRTDFCQFFLWEHVMDLNGLILDNSQFGRIWCLEKTLFYTIFTLRGCGSLEIINFGYFLHCEDVVVLKGLIFISSSFDNMWWT